MSSASSTIPVGYKQTEVGVFPEDWMTIDSNFSSTVCDGRINPKFHRAGIPFLSVNNLVNNRIDFSELRYISEEDHVQFSKKCKPERNDILLGKAHPSVKWHYRL